MTATPNVIDGVEVEPMTMFRNQQGRPSPWSEADEVEYVRVLAACHPLGCESRVRDFGEHLQIVVHAPRWHSWKRDPERGAIECRVPRSESLRPWVDAILEVIDEGLVATPRR